MSEKPLLISVNIRAQEPGEHPRVHCDVAASGMVGEDSTYVYSQIINACMITAAAAAKALGRDPGELLALFIEGLPAYWAFPSAPDEAKTPDDPRYIHPAPETKN